MLLVGPVYEPVPVPVQPRNKCPGLGCADMAMVWPALYHPLVGVVVPAPLGKPVIVR